jgi:putative CocE/NonD family hydrolase
MRSVLPPYPLEDPPMRQNDNEARPDVLSFTGPVLPQELVLPGWPVLELHGSSDRDDTTWHVKITDVDPDGVSRRVTQGCLRAAHRESLAEPTPLTPGEPTLFTIELWPAHHVFRPGHRVRLTVTSSDFPWFARSLNQFGLVSEQDTPLVTLNTVHHGGPHRNRLVLPIEGGADFGPIGTTPPVGPPEGNP